MYFKLLVPLLAAWLFLGCSAKFGQNVPAPYVRATPHEDQLIINALLYKKSHDLNSSIKSYDTLYNLTHKPEYIFEKFQIMYRSKAYKNLLKELNSYLKDAPNSKELLRYKVAVLNALNNTDAAKRVAFKLLDITKAPQDYRRVASLYLAQNHFKSALKYLESAYELSQDESTLNDLTTIMYLKLGLKQKAIAYLEGHSRKHGCSTLICEKLAAFYSDMDDIKGQISVYKRLYTATHKAKYAQAIIKAYAYNRNNYGLIKFLEESHYDDALLLSLYMAQKKYDKSIGLSNQLYLQTNDPHFQAQYAISLYEGSKKPDKKLLQTVITNLKQALKHAKPNANYLNYLGYLMIDHDIDVKEGLRYISKALELDANSGFFLDSLAWGYYKIHECKKALQSIEKARSALGKRVPEVEAHYKMIKKCQGIQ